MAHTHEVHGTPDDTATSFITGFTLAIAGLALALVIGGLVLFIVQPWDNNGGGNGITNNNNAVPNNQPDAGSGNGGSLPSGQ